MAGSAEFNLVGTSAPMFSGSAPTKIGIKLETNGYPHFVVQATQDIFAISNLIPYASWEAFSKAAIHLWHKYRTDVAPKSSVRIALKYTNLFEIPTSNGMVMTEEYFRAYANIPDPTEGDNILTVMNQSFMQVSMPQTDIMCDLILTLTQRPSRSADRLPYLLDIEIIRAPPIPVSADSVWEIIELQHDRIYEAFNYFITEKTRELIR